MNWCLLYYTKYMLVNIMVEIWKLQREFDLPWNAKNKKHYTVEVSNYGRIRKNGEIVELKQLPNKYVYARYCGETLLHRVVAKLFIPNPENKPCIDHIDGNKLNNRVDNLRWVTYTENMLNPITRKQNSEIQKGLQAGEKNPMYGRKQTKETKKLISEKARRKRFINNGEIETTVDIDNLDNYINNGWVKGRLAFPETQKMKISEARKNTHRVYDNSEHTKWHMEKN